MPTILHTGQGLYPTVKRSSYDPLEAVKSAGEEAQKILTLDFQLRKEAEEKMLKMLDVKTEDMVVSQLQDKAINKLNAIKDNATQIMKQSKGRPDIKQELDIQNQIKEFETWQNTQATKAQSWRKLRDIVYQDNGNEFDFNDSIASINKYLDNPEGNEIGNVVPRYKTQAEIYHDIYSKGGFTWGRESYKLDNIGNVQKGTYFQPRIGLETPEKRSEEFNNQWDSNYELRRSVYKEWNEKYKDLGKYKTFEEYKNKEWAENFGLPQTDRTTEREITKRNGLIIFGGGIKLKDISAIPQTTSVAPNLDSPSPSVKYKNKSIGRGLMINTNSYNVIDRKTNEPIKSDGYTNVEIRESFGDVSVGVVPKGKLEIDVNNSLNKDGFDDFNSAMVAITSLKDIQGSGRYPIQGEDGKWYISNKVNNYQEVYVENDDDVMTQLGSYFFNEEGDDPKERMKKFLLDKLSQNSTNSGNKSTKKGYKGVPQGGF